MERREASVRIIEKVFYEGAFLQDALTLFVYDPGASVLQETEKKGTVFLSRGTAARKVMLSALLSRLTTGGLSRIKKTVRALLLTALFELIHGDTAGYAAVNAWVELTGKLGFPRLKGFVNAVLRRFCREKEDLLSGLSVREKLSFSPYLYDLTVSSFGEARTKAIGEWFLSGESERFSVRVNESRIDPERFVSSVREAGMTVTPTGVTSVTFFISGFERLRDVPGYEEGWFYPEAPAMTLSVEALRDRILKSDHPLRILDAAASPGGKTLHFADLIALAEKQRSVGPEGGRSKIIAADVSEEKVGKLQENVLKYGFSDFVETLVRDASVPHPETGLFDIVNLDVPCSGLSVLAGKPEGKENVTKEVVEALTGLQQKILNASAPSVKNGGVLVYSTCTYDPAENGENVRRFLETHPEFTLSEERLILPGELPSDGFYYAVMERSGR